MIGLMIGGLGWYCHTSRRRLPQRIDRVLDGARRPGNDVQLVVEQKQVSVGKHLHVVLHRKAGTGVVLKAELVVPSA
jgi:hypothetical protein